MFESFWDLTKALLSCDAVRLLFRYRALYRIRFIVHTIHISNSVGILFEFF